MDGSQRLAEESLLTHAANETSQAARDEAEVQLQHRAEELATERDIDEADAAQDQYAASSVTGSVTREAYGAGGPPSNTSTRQGNVDTSSANKPLYSEQSQPHRPLASESQRSRSRTPSGQELRDTHQTNASAASETSEHALEELSDTSRLNTSEDATVTKRKRATSSTLR